MNTNTEYKTIVVIYCSIWFSSFDIIRHINIILLRIMGNKIVEKSLRGQLIYETYSYVKKKKKKPNDKSSERSKWL